MVLIDVSWMLISFAFMVVLVLLWIMSNVGPTHRHHQKVRLAWNWNGPPAEEG